MSEINNLPSMSGLSDDLLTGAQAIADELGWSRRRVYNEVEKRHGWPIWVDGGTVYSSRVALKQHIALRARQAINRCPDSKSRETLGDDHQNDLAA